MPLPELSPALLLQVTGAEFVACTGPKEAAATRVAQLKQLREQPAPIWFGAPQEWFKDWRVNRASIASGDAASELLACNQRHARRPSGR
jgi:hypothetical protein